MATLSNRAVAHAQAGGVPVSPDRERGLELDSGFTSRELAQALGLDLARLRNWQSHQLIAPERARERQSRPGRGNDYCWSLYDAARMFVMAGWMERVALSPAAAWEAADGVAVAILAALPRPAEETSWRVIVWKERAWQERAWKERASSESAPGRGAWRTAIVPVDQPITAAVAEGALVASGRALREGFEAVRERLADQMMAGRRGAKRKSTGRRRRGHGGY